MNTALYDLTVWFLTMVVSLFFREIKQRGAHKIPHSGPVIFVAAPHANQFVDPLILLRECKRRIGFLAAAKTMDRKYVGAFAKAVNSIPVARPQDLAKPGKGTILIQDHHSDPTRIHGLLTEFTSQLNVGDSISLPKDLSSSEVTQVISDTEIVVKKDMTKDLRALELLINPEGTAYKCVPRVDQAVMYKTVYDRLNAGGCIGIFPEGGSHDRFEMLPLKAGVAIMALGAMAEHPGLDVKIVPCGLNYFHPHKFRSRAVVEFGDPITIPKVLVDRFIHGGTEKRDAAGTLLEVIYQALKTVTVNAGDYETLMVIQAGRRLYRPADKKLSTGKVLELNRRFVAAYQQLKDRPEIQEIKDKVLAYNMMLKYHGLRDHQVKRTQVGGPRALMLLLYRTVSLSTMGLVALPGFFLNLPIALIARYISYRKAKEALATSSVKIAGRDVLATWKLLVALVLLPLFYWFYAFIVLMIAIRSEMPFYVTVLSPFVTLCLLPFISYASLRFGETSLDIFRSLRPLFLSLSPPTAGSVRNLQTVREELSRDLTKLINQHGPELFPDFEKSRVIFDKKAPSEPTSPSTYTKFQWLANLPGAVTDAISGARPKGFGDSIFNWSDIGNDDTADDVFFFQRENEQTGSPTVSGSSTPGASGTRSRSSSFGEGLSITSITTDGQGFQLKNLRDAWRSAATAAENGGDTKAAGVNPFDGIEQSALERRRQLRRNSE